MPCNFYCLAQNKCVKNKIYKLKIIIKHEEEKVYVKENNIAGNDNIDKLRTDIADRYEISVEQIDIREAGGSG